MKPKIFYAFLLFFIAYSSALAQKVTVAGTVKDSQGDPLLGVYILIKGTNTGAITDDKGIYTIVANAGDVLYFSFVGMKSVEKKVTATSKTIDVTMQDNVTEFKTGVTVIGYGSAKDPGSTVSRVETVSAKEISETPTANAMDAMQGKVAGVVVTTDTGDPTKRSTITIHGFSSFNAALGEKGVSNPLYVVDGVAIDGGMLVDLDANDIENISVFKDAASTSIYGSRAANGVIYVTTKRGKKNERTTITLSQQIGFSSIASTRFFDNLMSPAEYMDFWAEKNPSSVTGVAGSTPAQARERASQILAENPYNTKWYRIFYRDFVPYTRTNASISGGTSSTTYYLSASYLNQEGVTLNSDYKRYTLTANIDTEINKWLKAGVNLSIGHNESDASSGSLGGSILALPFYSPTDENGRRRNYIPSVNNPRLGFYHPEYVIENNPGMVQGEDMLPTGYLKIEPIKNLIFKTQAGMQYTIGEQETIRPLPSYIDYQNGTNTTTTVTKSSNKTTRKTFTNTLEYKFNIGADNIFTVLAGQESIELMSKSFRASTTGQPVDGLTMLRHGTTTPTMPTDTKNVITYNSYFGRLEYSFASKYFVDLSGRRDGASIFGKNNRYGNFWAIGAKWRAKNESFLKEIEWLSDLNIRFSTGISGNPSGSAYSSITQVGTVAYNGQIGYQIASLGNPDLQWEKQRKTTFGIDTYLFGSTSFNIEYYSRRTEGSFSNRQTSSLSGFSSFPDNSGTIENSGLDISLSSTVYRSANRDFTIRPYVNMNYNHQKIVSIFGGRKQFVASGASSNFAYEEGGAIYYAMPIFKGVNPDDGRPQWYLPGENKMEIQTDDANVTTSFNQNRLAQSTGKKRQAPVNGGFGLNLTYKTFSVDLSFSYSIGKYMINWDRYDTENPSTFGITNLSRNVLNYWRNPGDDARNPRIEEAFFTRVDSRLLEDASFIRLKNVGVSYRLPKDVMEEVKFFRDIRFYASARNLLTFTKFEGTDPEFDGRTAFGGYPPSKQYTFGVELKF